MRYVLRSCSRDILLVCKPIGTLKISKNSRLGAFGKLQVPENQLGIDNLPVLEPYLICQSDCKPIEYRGSSYEICSALLGEKATQPHTSATSEPDLANISNAR
jgi:hypothetical protein